MNDKPFDFELNLLFKNEKHPIVAFKELSDIFQLLMDYDEWMLGYINAYYATSYSLTDIEYSSIRTKIAQILKGIPDEAIKSLDLKTLIGVYLVKVKYFLLKYLEQNKNIDSKESLMSLVKNLKPELKKVQSPTQINISEINLYFLLNNIDDFQKIINQLPNNETIEFKSPYGTAKISKGINLNKAKILSELGTTLVDNKTTEILKVKKIDFLSNEAKWEFKLGKRTIPAKILDKHWLEDYHNRSVILMPEDSLKVILRTTYTFSNNNEHSDLQYEIIEVLEVITPTPPNEGNTLFT